MSVLLSGKDDTNLTYHQNYTNKRILTLSRNQRLFLQIRKILVEILVKRGIINTRHIFVERQGEIRCPYLPAVHGRSIEKEGIYMQMTRKIIRYISDHSLSAEEISAATGVEAVILQEEVRALNASELLEICQYLKLDPWSLFDP